MSGKALDENRPADLSKGILWTINDISLRKKYEEQLNQKQILLKNILLTIPDMLWLKDQDGVYLACNPEFEKFFGDKEGNIVGKTDYDYVDKPLADFFRMNDKKAMKAKGVNKNEEKVTYATDGREVLLHTSKKAMKDKEDNIIGVLGIGHDITELKRRENELKELNILANSLTKSQQVLLSLFDKGDSVLTKMEK
ncbi:MAG: PAS domain-containing protein [Halarcobacter ebronensis]